MHISNQVNVINYLGSKFSLLPWLLPHLEHVEGVKSWVDVFGGSGKNSYSKKEVRECIWTNYEVNKRNLSRLF